MPVQPPTSRTANPMAVSPSSSRKSGNRRSAALAIILLAQLMVVLDATIVNIALPKIQTALSFQPRRPVVGAERLLADLRRPAASRRAQR